MPSWLQSLTPADKERWMLEAVELAERGRGRTAPNPCVGALLLRDGVPVARGWHRAFGSAHAEVEAITEARAKGVDCSQCAMWVTLEPCNHVGKTPPCSRAILEAGIRQVFIGTRDPNQAVAGGGAELLQSRGVGVETGIAWQACRDLITDFLIWQQERRPFLTLKLAATLDGKIGSRYGRPLAISGPKAREAVQAMRRGAGAVLIGGNTSRQDDPRLTCRLDREAGTGQPLAVVLTSRLPSPGEGGYLLRHRPSELLIWTDRRAAESPDAETLRALGVRVWPLGPGPEAMDIRAALQRLFAEEGCHYLLCEGGGRLAASLAEMGLVDELHLFLAPTVLGDSEAPGAFSGRRVEGLEEALPWRLVASRTAGRDVWLVYRPGEAGRDEEGSSEPRGHGFTWTA